MIKEIQFRMILTVKMNLQVLDQKNFIQFMKMIIIQPLILPDIPLKKQKHYRGLDMNKQRKFMENI